jgi:hypothetical protein
MPFYPVGEIFFPEFKKQEIKSRTNSMNIKRP